MNEHNGELLVQPDNFSDVGTFHTKFNLDNVIRWGPGPREMDRGLMLFRIKFLREELEEFEKAVGFEPAHAGLPAHLTGKPIDHETAFDSLLDLAYVTFGTAHLLGYPWQEGWEEVQRVNMLKERCEIDHPFIAPTVEGSPDECWHHSQCFQPRHKHSLRGNINDVIKPPGWTPPNIRGILERFGWKF